MKYTAQGESPMVNKALKRTAYSYKESSSAIWLLLHFILKEVLNIFLSLKFNVLSTHLLNKEMFFFDKICQ